MNIDVDPGKNTGVAIYSGPTPAVTTMTSVTLASVQSLLGWCQRAAAARGETLNLQVEDQYAKVCYVRYRGKMKVTIDFPALKSLIRSAEVWVLVAEDMGIPWIRTMPSTWQGPMLATAPKTRNGKELDTKQKSLIVVPQIWKTVASFVGTPDPVNIKRVPATKLNEHVRDAMLMGRWRQLHGDAAC